MNSFDKQTMRQWLGDMDRVKAENKRFEELLTKGKDKRIEVLIKENRELRKENKELKEENKKLKKYYDRDKEELSESCYALAKENKELKNKLNILYHYV